MKEVKNKKAYPMAGWENPVKFIVSVKLDPLSGAWDNTDDFVQWFFSHNYVQSVEIMGAEHEAG